MSMTATCPKDGATLGDGLALFHVTLSEMTDYGVVYYPQHPQAPVRLISCLKCPKCGYSRTHPE